MAAETVTIRCGGLRLYGVLELPGPQPSGGVVLVHGWSGCRIGPHRILVDTARALARCGFAALRFDLQGRGESEGDPLKTDLDGMIDNTLAAADLMRERIGREVPLMLIGMCSGGNVALAAAAVRNDIDAVVTWSTYPFQEQHKSAQDISRTGHFAWVYLRKAFRPATWRKLFRGAVDFGMVRKALFGHYAKGEGTVRNLQRSGRDILGPLADYSGRVYFLYGGADPEADAAQQAFGEFFGDAENRVAVEAIADANHNFYSLPWKAAAIETTCRWAQEATGD
jgi:dienelactone hydrolase